MAIYAVNYTLRSEDHDYSPLFERLESFQGACHVQESFWLIRTPMDKDDVFKALVSGLLPGDALFIMVYTNGGATWTGTQDEPVTKLQDMLFDPGHPRPLE